LPFVASAIAHKPKSSMESKERNHVGTIKGDDSYVCASRGIDEIANYVLRFVWKQSARRIAIRLSDYVVNNLKVVIGYGRDIHPVNKAETFCAIKRQNSGIRYLEPHIKGFG